MSVSTYFPAVSELPDPANIVTPGEWYLLQHISSPLIQYNHENSRFEPLLAESWQIDGSSYQFKLKPGLKFSDGSPIQAKDVLASIKRLILKRTSTHFALWDYIEGCPKISSMTENCPGLEQIDELTVRISLLKRLESFFLFMACPEGGIWPESSIDPTTGNISFSSFSGPYAVDRFDDALVVLKRNENSPLIQEFKEAPHKVNIFIGQHNALDLFQQGKIDFYIEMTRPFYEKAFIEAGLERIASPFNTIIYLFKVANSKQQISSRFIAELWDQDLGDEMIPADTFLPFGSLGALNRQDFLASLPANSGAETVRVALPQPFFHSKMMDLFNHTAKLSKESIEFVSVPNAEARSLFDPNTVNEKNFSFVLSPYVAAERFPSVQINFLLEGRKPPFELKHLDLPDASPERMSDLKMIQTWMLKEQWIVPLVFVRNHIISSRSIDIGQQPINDAEIQIWRMKKL